MSRPSLRPSAWLPRLLEHVLPPEDVEGALGDLEEDFCGRELSRRGRLRAELWYVGEATSLVVASLRERTTPRTVTKMTRMTGTKGMREGWTRDLRHAFRSMRRNPGTSVVIALTVALGVGATTSMFGVVSAAYLRPLPLA
ncbi:MAG TPA: hypothetical protein VE173_11340, partial [Longimicrobiales bacterium]|nr:hypothetical protein [Longimicrobiales bacterium]